MPIGSHARTRRPPPPQTHVSIGQRNWLHEVHTLGVDLDEREKVAGLDGIAERMQPGAGVRVSLPCEAPLRVLRRDEVLPRLPAGKGGRIANLKIKEGLL